MMSVVLGFDPEVAAGVATRLGSSDEAKSGEQRNNDTRKVRPPWSDGTVPPGTEVSRERLGGR
jgi:hypothetical protein